MKISQSLPFFITIVGTVTLILLSRTATAFSSLVQQQTTSTTVTSPFLFPSLQRKKEESFATRATAFKPLFSSKKRSALEEPAQAEDSSSSLITRVTSSSTSPLGAIAILSFIVLFHESGHYLMAKLFGIPVNEFSVGFGPELGGLEAFNGDVFHLRALPVGGYVSLNSANLANLAIFPRIAILAAGVAFNLFLALVIYAGQIMTGDGLPVFVFDRGIVVGALDDTNTASRGLLKPGNVIQKINGKTLLAAPTSSEMRAERTISKLIDEVQKTSEGDWVTLTVWKNPKTSNAVKDVQIKPRQKEQDGPLSLGLYLLPNFVGVERRKTTNPLEAATFASSMVVDLAREAGIGLATVVGDFLSFNKSKKKTSSTSKYRVSGPIGVIQRATKVVETQNVDAVLSYAAAVSINLGVLNCLPVPPSDGFQILCAISQTLLVSWQQHL